MTLEVGQVFNKFGMSFYVLDILDFNFKKYVLMAMEKEKTQYHFYEVISNGKDYKLKMVEDDLLEYNLFEVFEQKVVEDNG